MGFKFFKIFLLAFFLFSSLFSALFADDDYIAPNSFETDRLKFQRVRSAQADIDCHEVLFADDGDKTAWYTNFPLTSLQETDQRMKLLRKQEALGYYDLPIGFSHYNIHSKDSDTLIGRFCLFNSSNSNRLETGIYLVKSARQKGFGKEALSGVLKNVINPGLGKPFNTDSSPYCDPDDTPLSKDNAFLLKHHDVFEGVFAKCDQFYNYGSLAVHQRVGFKIQWVGHIPFMFYPSNDQIFLADSHVVPLLKITKTFSQIAIIWEAYFKHKYPAETDYPSMKMDGTKAILEDFEDSCSDVLGWLEEIFQTNEPHTLLSSLDLWLRLEADPDELKDFISVERARSMLALTQETNSKYRESKNLAIKHKRFIEEELVSKEEQPSGGIPEAVAEAGTLPLLQERCASKGRASTMQEAVASEKNNNDHEVPLRNEAEETEKSLAERSKKRSLEANTKDSFQRSLSELSRDKRPSYKDQPARKRSRPD